MSMAVLSATQTVGKLRMLGNAVFKHAVTDIAGIIRTCAEEAGYDVPTIDWFVRIRRISAFCSLSRAN